jgi:hypothetical protein
VQVFFAPNVTDTEWKVVLHKEARSRREGGEEYKGVLGAPRLDMHSVVAEGTDEASIFDGKAEVVNTAHVRLVKAEREDASGHHRLRDCDWVDDDNDDDLREFQDDDWEEVEADEIAM